MKYAYLHGVLLKYESETHKLLQSQLDSRTKYFKNARLQFGQIHRQLSDLIRGAESAVQNKFISPVHANHLLEKLEMKLDACQAALDKVVQLSSPKKGPNLILSPRYEDYLKIPERTLITIENVGEVEILFETETAEPVETSPEGSIVESTENQTIPGQMKSQGHSFIVGSSFLGYISHVRPMRATNCFYMQPLMNQCEEFRRLQKELELTGSTTPPNLREGMLVAARYQADQVWYRGVIEQLKTEAAFIFFIDFGNKELVSFESIRTLDKQHHSLPAQAVFCSLSNRKHGSFDRISSKDFKALVEERILGAYVEQIRPGSVGHIGDNQELKFYVTL
jgi:Tudor domain